MQMVSDVPLGAFLSGGVDSSLVVSSLAEYSSHPGQTFSVGYDEPKFDEPEPQDPASAPEIPLERPMTEDTPPEAPAAPAKG